LRSSRLSSGFVKLEGAAFLPSPTRSGIASENYHWMSKRSGMLVAE